MEDWDEEKLKDVVDQKHGEKNKSLPPTSIVSKKFVCNQVITPLQQADSWANVQDVRISCSIYDNYNVEKFQNTYCYARVRCIF